MHFQRQILGREPFKVANTGVSLKALVESNRDTNRTVVVFGDAEAPIRTSTSQQNPYGSTAAPLAQASGPRVLK